MWKMITRSRAGVKRVGQRGRRGLEREGLGQLGAEEDRPFEVQLLEGRSQQRRRFVTVGTGEGGHARDIGVAASSSGVSVMASPLRFDEHSS